MAEQTKGMKPIWFFVGLLLLVVGLIIVASGLYYLAYPPDNPAAMHHLHPDVWWGGIMAAFGAFLLWLNHGVVVE